MTEPDLAKSLWDRTDEFMTTLAIMNGATRDQILGIQGPPLSAQQIDAIRKLFHEFGEMWFSMLDRIRREAA